MPSISGHVASVDVDRTVKMMLGCVQLTSFVNSDADTRNRSIHSGQSCLSSGSCQEPV